MADLKISQLPVFTSAVPAVDAFAVVSGGTTKQITTNQVLGSGGTATLASATITGALTVDTSTLVVDATNDRVGIGTATPLSKLQSAGTVSITDGASSGAANGLHLRFDTSINTGYISAFHATVDNRDLIYDAKSHVWQIATGTAMTLNATGRLGVGITPNTWDNPYKCVQLNGGSLSVYPSTDIYLSQNAYNSGGWKRVAAGYASQYIQTNSEHRFLIAGTSPTVDSAITFTQAMTLDASGVLLVGLTTSAATNSGSFIFTPGTSAYGGVLSINHSTSNINGSGFVNFNYNITNIGSISQNGTTGVLYNITSDYRLKESVVPLSGGLARVNALKPSVYNWKSDGSTGEGFLAHELAEVVPFAVSGEKDAVSENGKIKPQGIDMSRIVPILVAAIQELTAEVNALKNA